MDKAEIEELLKKYPNAIVKAMDQNNGIPYDVVNVEYEAALDDKPDTVWVYLQEID